MAAAKPPRRPENDEVRGRIRPLVEAVRRGEMTPRQVDDRCRAEGLVLPHHHPESQSDSTSNATWWLPLAVLFYAWRDLEKTREQWQRFEFWGRAIWQDSQQPDQILPLVEAEDYLHSDLTTGIVRGFGTNQDYKAVQVEPQRWSGLKFSWKTKGDVIWGAVNQSENTSFGSVFVLRHEVVPLWTSEVPTVRDADQPKMRDRVSANKGGRPREYDWDSMWVEIVRLAVEGSISNRSVLTKHLQEWFQKTHDKEPAESLLRDRLSTLYDTLGWK